MSAALSPAPRPRTYRTELLARLGLQIERPLSDDGDSFVTLLCRDSSGSAVVLKYVSGGGPDAYRRLHTEAQLLIHLPSSPPLCLLAVRTAARDHLVTAFDSGVLLCPSTIGDPRVVALVAQALVRFQSSRLDLATLGIADRERLSTYYLKVLAKHIGHLWPTALTAREAARCVAIVTGALPAIGSAGVPCHGDFMPTNLLFNAAAETITFTDLEGFMSRNHPLFDLIALMTVSDQSITEWSWQHRLLREYLAHAAAIGIGLDAQSRTFRKAYRGILTFFLVYRWNEAAVYARGLGYFNGVGKFEYFRRKARDLAVSRTAWREPATGGRFGVHARNLRLLLDDRTFDDHFCTMLQGAS